MRLWGVALLALGACSTPNTVDEVSAELSSPLHAMLKVRERDDPTPCKKTGLERLMCLFDRKTSRCAWIEIDTPALAAAPPMGAALADCSNLPLLGARVRIAGVPPLELVSDAAGERIIMHDAKRATALYVLAGRVVAQHELLWPVPWASVPTLDDELDQALVSADAASRQLLIDYARSKGDDAVVNLMASGGLRFDAWEDLYRGLGKEDQQRSLENLHAALRADVDIAAVTGLIDLPDLQPADYADIVARAVESTMEYGYNSSYDLGELIRELAARNDRRAGVFACRHLGAQLLSGLAEEYGGDFEASEDTLAVLARGKTPCPWVLTALEPQACSTDLRCELDGGQPDEDSSEGAEQLPLCDARAAAHQVDAWLADESSGTSLLLAAAYAQGPLPRDVVLRNARRLYRFIYPPVSEELADAPEEERPCHVERLAEALCRLPATANDFTFAGCRLHVDDRQRVVRVEQVKPGK